MIHPIKRIKYHLEISRRLQDSIFYVMGLMDKLWLYPHSQKQDFWKSEIFNEIHEIERNSYSGKFPSYRSLNRIFMRDIHNYFDAAMRFADETETEPVSFDRWRCENDLRTKLNSYFKFLALSLSVKGNVTESTAYDILDALMKD